MKKIAASSLKLVWMFVLGATAFSASAQTTTSKFYGEVGYTSLSYSESGYTFEPGALRIILGAEVHENVGIEGLLGVGIKDGSTRVGNVNVTTKVDSVWGVYLKPKMKVTPDVEVFARLGFAESRATASIPGFSISGTQSSFSYGMGLNFNVAKNTSLNVDYMNYYSKNGSNATGFTVGVGLKF